MTTTKAKAETPKTEEVPDETAQQAPEGTQQQDTPSSPEQDTAAPAQAPQAPSVGRVVHYQLPGGGDAPLAAIITAVHDDSGDVSLVVYREHLQFFRRGVKFAEKPKDGCWSWPPRV